MDLSTRSVTFLLTDIEGSTRLWEEHPEEMPRVLARHDALAAEIIARHGGTLVKKRGEGDSLFTVFTHATDALAAACVLQQAFHTEAWPAGTPLRVRVALHTGGADYRAGDFYGPTVNRCARLRSIGHGGQSLLSLATAQLVRSELPPGINLKDLGSHRLKDLQQPEHVWQIVHPDLPENFPPLRSLQAFANNLPVHLTSFIGREKEIADVRRLLSSARLLTLTGAGGCGKTRLALQVAAEVLEAYPDGVWLVELASLSDPVLLVQAAASVLGVREQPGRALTETLVEYLQQRRMLLLLDNCEHLVEACARLADMLIRFCPHTQLLATSREALGLAGETIYRIPSLSLPEPDQPIRPENLLQYESVRLFRDRAIAVAPALTLTADSTQAVAHICRRLDGIPLALELAAARVRALSVEQIAARLDDRFRLLTGGSRNVLPRQQTLRALVDWSYDLLGEEARTLLRRLAVFAGGWTLEAAEAVCAGQDIEEALVLDLLTSLVDRSLVNFEETAGEGRYRLQETIRQYAREKLLESGEVGSVRERHRDWFLALAEKAHPYLSGPEQGLWLDRLETEHDNLRAALDGCRENVEDAEKGLRLTGLMCTFWGLRGHLSEGRARCEAILSLAGVQQRTGNYADVLNGAGNLAWDQGDLMSAQALFERSLAIRRELGERRSIAGSLNNLGLVAVDSGECLRARAFFEEALAINREIGNKAWEAGNLLNLANMASALGDNATTRTWLEEALVILRSLGNRAWEAAALNNLGTLAQAEGRYAEARAFYENSLAIRRELDDRRGIAGTLINVGELACLEGEHAKARASFTEMFSLVSELGDRWTTAYGLERSADLDMACKDYRRAARLHGAAAALREIAGMPVREADRADYERTLDRLRTALGEEAFAVAWTEGRTMSMEQAVRYALDAPAL